MSSSPNTLFLLARHGLNKGTETGLLETWMWILSEVEESMDFISLHKSKTERAHKGGKIVDIRLASDDEIEEHQNLLHDLGEQSMQDTGARKIISFRVDPTWNKLWPNDAKSHQMAYKGIGHVDA